MSNTIASIREFNRYYVNLIGIMKNHILDQEYSLTESRIIFEISNARKITAREIKEKLSLDEGYVSRIVTKLVKDQLVIKEQSKKDKRVYFLVLTAKGKETADLINVRSDDQIGNIIAPLDPQQQTRIVELMAEIKQILNNKQ